MDMDQIGVLIVLFGLGLAIVSLLVGDKDNDK